MAKPWDDYDGMTPKQIKKKLKQVEEEALRNLSARLEEVERYEEASKKREEVDKAVKKLKKEVVEFTNRW